MKNFLVYLSTILFATSCSGIKTLSLQPPPETAKDAYIEEYPYENYSNRNFGTHVEFMACGWTAKGTPLRVRNLIEFDLSSIPANAKIIEAKLYLYCVDNTVNGPGHSILSGSNEAVLKRITSEWSETEVTWNTQPQTTDLNQITIPASKSDLQDYEIDVTPLISDIVKNPSEGFGLMFSLTNEDYYRRMMFGSSDYENPSKRPKLIVKYKKK